MRGWSPIALVIAGCAAPATPAGATVTAIAADGPPARTWRPLAHQGPLAAGAPLLLLDGTVIVQELQTERWWRLMPDPSGSYALGTWTETAAMPAGYTPLYAATAVLPDGRVIVEGGEYIDGIMVWSTRGAIYDPVADAWTEVAPPAGWTTIGDASGIVLDSGTFALSDCCSTNMALLDPATLTWTRTGGNKLDIHDEESWAMLPDGSVLTVDANNTEHPRAAERYLPAEGLWVPAGETPVLLSDLAPDGTGSHELGPNVLRADGTVLAIGGNGHDAIYDVASGAWSVAPDLPVVDGMQLAVADGPAALLPDGAVLVAASPGLFTPPTHFYEYAGDQFVEVAAPPNAPIDASFNQFMLMLPTGELMLTDFTLDIELYTPAPGALDIATPIITAAPQLVGGPDLAASPPAVAELHAGRTYWLAGTRLHGISQGAYYGDDGQSSTNYPLVRLTAIDTGHVAYCRTHDFSSMSIAPDAHSTTLFDVAPGTERGLARLEVIANGVASPAIVVDVK